MVHDTSCTRWRPRLVLALAYTMVLYWLVIFPRARRELRRWERHARAIPSPALRRHAVGKLNEEHLSAEGAAAFAVLARPRSRKHVVRLCVAFEVMFDLLDALGEEPAVDVLANNRRLHRALPDAFRPGAAPALDYYADHRDQHDGGYLQALLEDCWGALLRLPARRRVTATLVRCATRAGEAQSHNHATLHTRPDALASWAHGHMPDLELFWWEIAAAAGSPLGIFALVAAASDPHTSEADAAAIETTYFPWIGALHWLLESLVDQDDDVVSGNRSYVRQYRSPTVACERLAFIARRALADAGRLSHADQHTLLLAGMVSLNLSHHGARTPAARDAAAAVNAEMASLVAPLLMALRLRRLFARSRARAAPGRA